MFEPTQRDEIPSIGGEASTSQEKQEMVLVSQSQWGHQRYMWEMNPIIPEVIKEKYEGIIMKLSSSELVQEKDEIIPEDELTFIRDHHYMFSDQQLYSLSNIWCRGSTYILKSTARESLIVVKMMCQRYGLSIRDVLLDCEMLDKGVYKCYSATSSRCAKEKTCTSLRRVGCVTCARHKKG